MGHDPQDDKKCTRCGAPAEVTFVDVEGGKTAGEKVLCSACAMKEGLCITGSPAGRFVILVQALEHEKTAGGDTSRIHAVLKRLSGQDLPAEPAQWREWMREHPEKAVLTDDVFYNALSELDIKFFDSSHRGRAELLVALLDARLRHGEDASGLAAGMIELTGKNLPADPQVWREWMRSSPAEVRVDPQKFIDMLTEMGIMHSLGPFDGLTKKVDRENPHSTS
jgi:hypothetical protein